MSPRSLLALLLSGCLAPGPPAGPAVTPDPGPALPVSQLAGEVHLHQFPLGAHAWAAFPATPVPLAGVMGDQLVNLEVAATRREGRCTLYLGPHCFPACPATALCLAENTCVPVMPLRYVDAGEVRVLGSLLHPLIRLWFAGAAATYDADPPPGPTPLYAGGEQLHVSGGVGHLAFSGDIPAPQPMRVFSPDLTQPLRLWPARDLEVTWQPAGAELVVLWLIVSTADRGSGHVRCLGPDSGTLVVPQDLLAPLPGPPRWLRLEVERDEERLLYTGEPGTGILTHATFTAWRNDME